MRQCHSSAKVAWLLQRDKDVRTVCGFSKDDLPGDDALGRFLRKLVAHEQLLEECFTGLVKRLQELLPGFGAKLAGDSTDIKAYSNGHKKNPSDADGRWGAKGAGHHAGQKGKEKDLYWWFGYKLHLVVDALYEPPATPLY